MSLLRSFKVAVTYIYSSLVGQILVFNCRHQGLLLLFRFTFVGEDLSIKSEDQYFPNVGNIAIHVYNPEIGLTIVGHFGISMEKVMELSINILHNIPS